MASGSELTETIVKPSTKSKEKIMLTTGELMRKMGIIQIRERIALLQNDFSNPNLFT